MLVGRAGGLTRRCFGSRSERCSVEVARASHASRITRRDCSDRITHRAKLNTVRRIGSCLIESTKLLGEPFSPASPLSSAAAMRRAVTGRLFETLQCEPPRRSDASPTLLGEAGAIFAPEPAWNATHPSQERRTATQSATAPGLKKGGLLAALPDILWRNLATRAQHPPHAKSGRPWQTTVPKTGRSPARKSTGERGRKNSQGPSEEVGS